MLQLYVTGGEIYDQKNREFVYVNSTTLRLEHSLISLSKWESMYCIPFLTDKPKTVQQTLDYIKCMTLNPNVDPNIYHFISDEHILQINDYIGSKMTATTFSDSSKRKNRETVTAELIYWSMITLGIPVEFQKWHLNRLLTLIHVCNIKNDPEKKKMSAAEIMRRNTLINEQRKAQYNTSG